MTSVLASKSYTDAETGRFTEVVADWTDGINTANLVWVPHGYYYIALKKNKLPLQVILRWNLDRGVCVIPKAKKKDH